MAVTTGPLSAALQPLRSRLYTNVGYLWVTALAVSFLGFAFWTVVARQYPPEAVGLGGTVVTSLIIVSQVSQLGLGYAVIRFVHQSGHEAPLLLTRSIVAAAVASMFIGLVFLSTLPLWSQDLGGLLRRDPGSAGSFLMWVVVATLWAALNSIFIAYRRAVFVLALNLGALILRLPMVVALATMGSAMGIIAAHGLAVLAGTVLGALVFLPRCTGRRVLPPAFDVWKLAPLMPFALSNLVSHVLAVLSWQVLPLAVIALAGAKASGFFYIGWAVAGIVLLMTQQLALVLFAEGSHDPGALPRQTRGALAVGLALGGLFAVGTYALGDYVLLLFGRDYVAESGGVLKLMAAATPLAAVTYIYLGVQRVRGRLLPLVAVSAAVTLFMLGMTVALVPRIGIVGAGYSVLAGYGVGAVLSLLSLWRIVNSESGSKISWIRNTSEIS